jgi:hypothetical protein
MIYQMKIESKQIQIAASNLSGEERCKRVNGTALRLFPRVNVRHF